MAWRNRAKDAGGGQPRPGGAVIVHGVARTRPQDRAQSVQGRRPPPRDRPQHIPRRRRDRQSALSTRRQPRPPIGIGAQIYLDDREPNWRSAGAAVQPDRCRRERLWIKPSSHTKQKKLHITPLSAEAVAVAQQLLQLGLPNYDGVRAVWRKTKTHHRSAGRSNSRFAAFNGQARWPGMAPACRRSARCSATPRRTPPTDICIWSPSDLVDLVERTS